MRIFWRHGQSLPHVVVRHDLLVITETWELWVRPTAVFVEGKS